MNQNKRRAAAIAIAGAAESRTPKAMIVRLTVLAACAIAALAAVPVMWSL